MKSNTPRKPGYYASQKRRKRQELRDVVGYTPERIYYALAQADEQTRLQVLALLKVDISAHRDT